MNLGKWHLGWSRNIAIGIIWTRKGAICLLFLGLTLSKGLPTV